MGIARWELLLYAAFSAGIAGIAGRAAAQSPDGRFKLGMETAIFEYSSRETDAGSGASTANDSIDEVSFGIATSRSGVELAYGVSDTIVVGARLMFVHRSTETAPGTPDVDTTQFGFVPHLDYVFPSGDSARVFLGPMVGVMLADVEHNSTQLFLFGGSFGAHIFAARRFSIDPRLSVAYALGKTDVAAVPPAPDLRADAREIAVSAMLGISAWL